MEASTNATSSANHTELPTTSTDANTNTTQDTTATQASSSSSSATPAQAQHCTHCANISTTLKPCPKCHSTQYCSRDCQKADMKKHKKVCAAAAQIYAQTADFKPATPRVASGEGHRRGLQKWQFDT